MLYTLPFSSAFIGWFTTWIAVKMLFYPLKKVNFLFFSIQGVFPKNQNLVAERIGKMVADELLSTNDIKDKITHPAHINKIKKEIEFKIDDYLENTFPSKYPITSIFFGERRKAGIKNDLMDEIEKSTPEVINSYMKDIEESFNVEKIVREKIEELPPKKLEVLLNDILRKEFMFIELIGGAAGFLIGLLQLLIAIL